ncbi:hypothetical protein RRG08_007424 [Elysia crispata]|uniref:Uncharacterized protein n=1 Tax=Elysia crispata TaxID=231223 RepID=A0AAE1AFP3_9GAST|nr:hypothetical protein RRG08_007424 [Elysia crispata]
MPTSSITVSSRGGEEMVRSAGRAQITGKQPRHIAEPPFQPGQTIPTRCDHTQRALLLAPPPQSPLSGGLWMLLVTPVQSGGNRTSYYLIANTDDIVSGFLDFIFLSFSLPPLRPSYPSSSDASH